MIIRLRNISRRLQGLIWGLLSTSTVFSQQLDLSKNPDFSTADNTFIFNETLYARVTAPQLDFNNIVENEYELKSINFGDEARGVFINNRNATYTIAISLASLNQSENKWEFRVELKDRLSHEFKATVNVTISKNPLPVIVELEGEIEMLTANSLRLSGKTVSVDAATVFTEFGQPLKFADLQLDWKVRVRAEQRADNLLWALTIDVLERAATNTVTARGRMANLQDSVMIVNNINFRIVATTTLQDKNGAPVALTGFRVGMLVEARGAMQPAGKIIANFIKIEDDIFLNKEIEFTGIVNARFSRPPLPDSIQINGELFEVDGQTELRGFSDEPIQLAGIRPGENVQIKAMTRQNRLPLAIRLKRRLLISGEVEVKGRIEQLQTAALRVAGVEFLRAANTIILDDENLFIPYTALRVGLTVEVAANRQADGSLLAAIIRIEDDDDDEVELTGQINGRTDTSLTVTGFVFRVNAATAVFDENRIATQFSRLFFGQLVEIHGDRRFDGSLLATEIFLEDLLPQNEIELRGAIARITGNVVRVTDLDFTVSGATIILDLNGAPAVLAQLAAGMIVEIRGRSVAGVWQAVKIKIENEIDHTVVMIGTIDSVAANTFFALRRSVQKTDRTILRGLNNEAISFSSLRVNDVVEVLVKQLSDSSFRALRIKRVPANPRDLEIRGKIMLRGATAITVAAVTFAVDATTLILNAANQPIPPADLRSGLIAVVKGSRQINGVFVANQIQLQDQREITGVVSEIPSGSVKLNNLSQAIRTPSFFVDEQNLPVNATDIAFRQQVRILANAVSGEWEILLLQILLRPAPTTVVEQAAMTLVPKEFALYQNFPNPFASRGQHHSNTIIRFTLPESVEFSLTIYNSLGQKVRTIVNGRLPAGIYERSWDGRNNAGVRVASGIYFYRLQAGERLEQRQLLLIR
jgi:hypothetical protein